MQESTTMRLSRSTHQELRRRADLDGLSLEAELRQLLRYDRQRRMAASLADTGADTDDLIVVEAGRSAVGRNLDAGR